MTDKDDLVVHFRQVITNRYNMYTWITVFTGVVLLLLQLVLDKATFFSSLASVACAFSIGLLIRNLNHREKMLDYLERNKDDHFTQLENYLESKQNQWERNLWIRLIVGAMTGLAMLFMMVFHAEPYWSMMISSAFITIIIAIGIIGWINFNDQILLHDIRRSHRDHHSNKPE